MLKCGHSFCSICIRKNLDKMLNPHRTTTYMQCPSCREKADSSDLIPNRTLAMVVSNFQSLRKDLLATLENGIERDIASKISNPSKILNPSNRNRVPVTKRMPHTSFHGMSKDKIRKFIESATKDSSIKLRLDGDKEVQISY